MYLQIELLSEIIEFMTEGDLSDWGTMLTDENLTFLKYHKEIGYLDDQAKVTVNRMNEYFQGHCKRYVNFVLSAEYNCQEQDTQFYSTITIKKRRLYEDTEEN
jgi:hypothetical protein